MVYSTRYLISLMNTMSESLDKLDGKPEKGPLETSNSAGPNNHQNRPSAGNVEFRWSKQPSK
jgi:hypothetical protein